MIDGHVPRAIRVQHVQPVLGVVLEFRTIEYPVTASPSFGESVPVATFILPPTPNDCIGRIRFTTPVPQHLEANEGQFPAVGAFVVVATKVAGPATPAIRAQRHVLDRGITGKSTRLNAVIRKPVDVEVLDGQVPDIRRMDAIGRPFAIREFVAITRGHAIRVGRRLVKLDARRVIGQIQALDDNIMHMLDVKNAGHALRTPQLWRFRAVTRNRRGLGRINAARDARHNASPSSRLVAHGRLAVWRTVTNHVAASIDDQRVTGLQQTGRLVIRGCVTGWQRPERVVERASSVYATSGIGDIAFSVALPCRAAIMTHIPCRRETLRRDTKQRHHPSTEYSGQQPGNSSQL